MKTAPILLLTLCLGGCLFGESNQLTYAEAVRMFGTPTQTSPNSSGGRTVVFDKAETQGTETYTLVFDKSNKCVSYDVRTPQAPAATAAPGAPAQGIPTGTHTGPVIGSRCSSSML